MTVNAVIVCFFPEKENLCRLVKLLSAQASSVFLVDNGSSGDWLKPICSEYGISYLRQDSNLGVAQALNIGIEAALLSQPDYVISFDQDSLPEPCMIEKLVTVAENVVRRGDKLAAIGPQLADIKGNAHPSFVRREGLFIRAIKNPSGVVRADLLISSGLLMRTEALRDIGLMIPELFIDGVDNEWCLRAGSKGYSLFGYTGATLLHDLGDSFAKFRGDDISVHSPFRYYYMIRNGLWIARQPWVSKEWKREERWRAFFTYIVYSFFVGDRLNNWKMMTLGFFHFLSGKMGKLD